MSNIVRINESELVYLISKVVKEQTTPAPAQTQQTNDRITNIASMLASTQTRMVPTRVIVNQSSQYNNKPLNTYFKEQKVTNQEVQQARALLQKMGVREGGNQPVSPNQLVAKMKEQERKKQAATTKPAPAKPATNTAATTTPTAPTAAAAPATV